MSFFKTDCEIEVSFEDIDMMGIVWHGNYMRYMEKARCNLFSKLKYTYLDMMDDNCAYPIGKLKAKFIKPAKLNDILSVATEIKEIEPALVIKYIFYNKKTKEKIYEATTMQIAIDIKTKKSIYQPPKRLIEILKKVKQ